MKAFVVNRIGDIGFLLAMFLTFQHFGTLAFSTLDEYVHGTLAGRTAAGYSLDCCPFSLWALAVNRPSFPFMFGCQMPWPARPPFLL